LNHNSKTLNNKGQNKSSTKNSESESKKLTSESGLFSDFSMDKFLFELDALSPTGNGRIRRTLRKRK